MRIAKAEYEGQLRVGDGRFAGLALPENVDHGESIRVYVTFESDGATEVVSYVIGKAHSVQLLLSEKGQYESTALGEVTLRPRKEAAGHSEWGFLLPAKLSKTFVQHPSAAPASGGCGADTNCEDVMIPLGFSGTVLPGEARADGIVAKLGNESLATWTFSGSQRGFPRVIEYQEPGTNARAKFQLSSVTERNGSLPLQPNLESGKLLNVSQGSVAYGPLDPRADVNPWDYYARQDAIWKASQAPQADGQTWLPAGIAAGIIFIGVAFILVRKLLLKA